MEVGVLPLTIMLYNPLRIFTCPHNFELCWLGVGGGGEFSSQRRNASTKGTTIRPLIWKMRLPLAHLEASFFKHLLLFWLHWVLPVARGLLAVAFLVPEPGTGARRPSGVAHMGLVASRHVGSSQLSD